MPYKDKEKQKESVKLAVQKHRKGITPESITGQGITYPPIVYALADPIKRQKLTGEVGEFKLLGKAEEWISLHTPLK